MPVRLAFPTISAIIHGTSINIPDRIMIHSFLDYLSVHESAILKHALSDCDEQMQSFSNEMVSQLICILSWSGCRQSPQPQKLRQLVVQVAHYEFFTKPLGALHALHCGVPTIHNELWNKFPVERLFALYKALSASPQQVLAKLVEPSAVTPDEERIFGYLTTFIGNLSQEELHSFLCFVTGSSSIIANDITISFNKLSGIARRPITHTCSCVLELSTNYLTYRDFSNEFLQVMRSDEWWAMDAIWMAQLNSVSYCVVQVMIIILYMCFMQCLITLSRLYYCNRIPAYTCKWSIYYVVL